MRLLGYLTSRLQTSKLSIRPSVERNRSARGHSAGIMTAGLHAHSSESPAQPVRRASRRKVLLSDSDGDSPVAGHHASVHQAHSSSSALEAGVRTDRAHVPWGGDGKQLLVQNLCAHSSLIPGHDDPAGEPCRTPLVDRTNMVNATGDRAECNAYMASSTKNTWKPHQPRCAESVSCGSSAGLVITRTAKPKARKVISDADSPVDDILAAHTTEHKPLSNAGKQDRPSMRSLIALLSPNTETPACSAAGSTLSARWHSTDACDSVPKRTSRPACPVTDSDRAQDAAAAHALADALGALSLDSSWQKPAWKPEEQSSCHSLTAAVQGDSSLCEIDLTGLSTSEEDEAQQEEPPQHEWSKHDAILTRRHTQSNLQAVPKRVFMTQQAFLRQRQKLAYDLYKEWNELIFDGKLPSSLPITWNSRLLSTAGMAVDDGTLNHLKTSRDQRCATSIDLSSKVIDSMERLQSTLAHEMCHVAAWVIDHQYTPHHGSAFYGWASQFMEQVPDIRITRLHNFQVYAPHKWQCVNPRCEQVYTRHKSTSINAQRHACALCKGRLEYLGKFGRDGAVQEAQQGNAFSKFVKENFASVQKSHPPGTPMRTIMKALGSKWTSVKEQLRRQASSPATSPRQLYAKASAPDSPGQARQLQAQQVAGAQQRSPPSSDLAVLEGIQRRLVWSLSMGADN